ncbi:MAG: hypothetical protein QXP39_00090 [Candidatus Aenigmatarchaeota archaeon]
MKAIDINFDENNITIEIRSVVSVFFIAIKYLFKNTFGLFKILRWARTGYKIKIRYKGIEISL